MDSKTSERAELVVSLAALPGLAERNEDDPASTSDVMDAVWNAEQSGDARFERIAMTVDLVAEVVALINGRPSDPFRGL